MKHILRFVSIFIIYIAFVPASSVANTGTYTISRQGVIAPPGNPVKVKPHKLNFFQRLIVKFYLKKSRREQLNDADKLAGVSLWLGIGACALLVVGLFFSGILFFSAILPAIAAMVTGGSALRNKTSQIGKARTGKALGLGALIAVGVLAIAGAIILAAFFSSLFE